MKSEPSRKKAQHFQKKRKRGDCLYQMMAKKKKKEGRKEYEPVMNIVIDGFPPVKSPLTSALLLN